MRLGVSLALLIVTGHASRNPDRHLAGRDIVHDDRVGADHAVFADLDGTDQSSPGTNHSTGADPRTPLAAGITDRVVPEEDATVANLGVPTHDGSDGMHEEDSVSQLDVVAQ